VRYCTPVHVLEIALHIAVRNSSLIKSGYVETLNHKVEGKKRANIEQTVNEIAAHGKAAVGVAGIANSS